MSIKKDEDEGKDPLGRGLTSHDYIFSALKAGAGAIPLCGSSLNELLELFVRPRMRLQMNLWMEEVTKRLRELENEGRVNISTLPEDPAFVSMLLESVNRAVKTHKSEKLQRLKNIVINSSLQRHEFDKQTLFLKYLDDFTEYHIKLLTIIWENQKLRGTSAEQDVKTMNKKLQEDIMPGHGDIAYSMKN
ncbi:MAG: hypothetical protein HRT44_13395 [Bdellovibrionales bacterium]|nr:hypothetical protein [Bdellovibrionales bacterium]